LLQKANHALVWRQQPEERPAAFPLVAGFLAAGVRQSFTHSSFFFFPLHDATI
jgi:hypothetical protein